MYLPEWQWGGGGQKYIMDYIVYLRICFLLIHILKDESYGLHCCVPQVINWWLSNLHKLSQTSYVTRQVRYENKIDRHNEAIVAFWNIHKHRNNCESCPFQITWKIEVWMSILSILSVLDHDDYLDHDNIISNMMAISTMMKALRSDQRKETHWVIGTVSNLFVNNIQL